MTYLLQNRFHVGYITALETRHRHETGSHRQAFGQLQYTILRKFFQHLVQRAVFVFRQKYQQRVVGVLKHVQDIN